MQDLPGVVFPDTIIALRVDSSRIDRKYLEFVWRSKGVRGQIEAGARTTNGTFKINQRVLEGLRIPVPTIEEQRRIAAVLGHADELRTKRGRAISLLDDLAQSVFRDMFRDIHDDDMATLGDYLTFVTSGGRGWAKYYSDSGSRFIRSLDVRMNEIDDQAAVYVTAPHNAEAKRTRVEVNDVLLTITGSLIGRVAPVPPDFGGAYISQHVAILRADKSKIDPEFLAFFLSLPSGGQRQIAHLQYGQTKPGLNFQQIREMRIPLPGVSRQRLFAENLGAIRRIAEANRAHLEDLERLFASLQHRAFRGEL